MILHGHDGGRLLQIGVDGRVLEVEAGLPFLILGAFLMERFFSLPGIGDLLIASINNGDYPVLKGLTMYIAIGYSLFNLLTDIMYAYVDPRVQLS